MLIKIHHYSNFLRGTVFARSAVRVLIITWTREGSAAIKSQKVPSIFAESKENISVLGIRWSAILSWIPRNFSVYRPNQILSFSPSKPYLSPAAFFLGKFWRCLHLFEEILKLQPQMVQKQCITKSCRHDDFWTASMDEVNGERKIGSGLWFTTARELCRIIENFQEKPRR